MNDKIQQARRAAFEAKYPVPAWVVWNVDRADYYSNFRDSTRKRQAENYSAKWNGFNAALDCVVIKLPPAFDDVHNYACYQGGWNDMRGEAVDAIESTNLGIKVE